MKPTEKKSSLLRTVVFMRCKCLVERTLKGNGTTVEKHFCTTNSFDYFLFIFFFILPSLPPLLSFIHSFSLEFLIFDAICLNHIITTTSQYNPIHFARNNKWNGNRENFISRNNFVAHSIYYVALKVLLKTDLNNVISRNECMKYLLSNLLCEYLLRVPVLKKKKKWNAFAGDRIECILVHNNTNKNPIKTCLYSTPTADKVLIWFASSRRHRGQAHNSLGCFGFRSNSTNYKVAHYLIAILWLSQFNALIPDARAHECSVSALSNSSPLNISFYTLIMPSSTLNVALIFIRINMKKVPRNRNNIIKSSSLIM